MRASIILSKIKIKKFLKYIDLLFSVSSEDRMRIKRLKVQERHNLDIQDFLITMVVIISKKDYQSISF